MKPAAWGAGLGNTPGWRRGWLPAAVLVLLALLAYSPVIIRGGYIWDDDDYVAQNETLAAPGGLVRIWNPVYPAQEGLAGHPKPTPQYYPLTFSSFWLEYQAWGIRPLGYHLDNVLLLGLSAVLLWRVLRRLRVPGAYFAAALLTVHPMIVESAAWVAERKNMLSGALALAALLAYARAARWEASAVDQREEPQLTAKDAAAARSEAGRRRRGWYAAATVFFVLALLSKTTAAGLPVVILLIAWWKADGPWRRHLTRMVPWIILGAVAGAYTAHLERTYVGAHGIWWDFSLVQKLERAGLAWWFYLGKILFPARLSFIYPKWVLDPANVGQQAAWLAAGGVLAGLVAFSRRIGRGLPAGLLAYSVLIFPALGFANVYPMRFSFVADHFAYFGAVPVLVLVAAGLTRAARWGYIRMARANATGGYGWATATGVLAAGLVAISGGRTWARTRVFETRSGVWKDTIAKNPRAWIAYDDLGLTAFSRGEVAAAIRLFEQARTAEPREPDPYANLGNAFLSSGQVADAEAAYRQGLALPPSNASAEAALHVGLGMVQGSRGDAAAAAEQFRLGIARMPDYPEAYFNLSVALGDLGKPDEARAALRQALRLRPDYPRARARLRELETAASTSGPALHGK